MLNITISPCFDFYEWVLSCATTGTVVRTGHHFTEVKARAAAADQAKRVRPSASQVQL